MAPPAVASGIPRLDLLLGGLFIGDNVLWHDDAGSLALVFCLNFLKASQEQGKAIVYVSFDRSPRNLLDKLGELAHYPGLTILDCFTHGKGQSSPIFLKFYTDRGREPGCRLVPVAAPANPEAFAEELYHLHAGLTGDVRFIFESLTGMQELWGSEERLLSFYSHACPRLYELNTIAYWLLEKNAHTPRFRAAVNQIAQVAVELTIKRGATALTILKAENRSTEEFHKPHAYWTKGLTVTFEEERRAGGKFNLGRRLREFRRRRGLSQSELARLVGVTPSTISQVESNLIYPSLPALMSMAEVLEVEPASFFAERPEGRGSQVFTAKEAVEIRLPLLPEATGSARLLHPVDFSAKAEPYLVEINPRETLPGHFFFHKGEELGYLLSGTLRVTCGRRVWTLTPGDLLYLTTDLPEQWHNPGTEVARLLWIKIK